MGRIVHAHGISRRRAFHHATGTAQTDCRGITIIINGGGRGATIHCQILEVAATGTRDYHAGRITTRVHIITRGYVNRTRGISIGYSNALAIIQVNRDRTLCGTRQRGRIRNRAAFVHTRRRT